MISSISWPVHRWRMTTRVLKHGETFGVFDRYGDIQPVGRGNAGRISPGHSVSFSRQEVFLNNDRPMLLSSTVKGR